MPPRSYLRPVTIWLMVVVLICCVVPVAAQPVPVCPAEVMLSLARAGAACRDLLPGTACFGVGAVAADGLTQPGDQVVLAGLPAIDVLADAAAPGDLSATALVIATEPGAENGVFALLLGDGTLVNRAPLLIEETLFATGAVVLRDAPAGDAPILGRLGINEAVIADGRDESGVWLRVRLPASGMPVWASAAGFGLEDTSRLAIVTVDETLWRPFQDMAIVLRGDAPFTLCDGALPSGVLLQAPSTTSVSRLRLNGVSADLRGTVWIVFGEAHLEVITLAGDLRLTQDDGSLSVFVPAGAAVRLPLDADSGTLDLAAAGVMPYTAEAVAGVPLNMLPSRIAVTELLDAAGITAAQEADQQSVQIAAAPAATPQPDTTCRRVTWRAASVRSGPGEFYDVTDTLPADTAITVVIMTRGADGSVWWQLLRGGWITPRDVSASGVCDEPAFVRDVPPPATNTLVMETCIPASGPLVAGQQVTIRFTPPAWNSFDEARQAVRTDPGRVYINRVPLRTSVSDPIRLGTVQHPLEDRYLRQFSAVWAAEPGTFRITGDWLSYEPLCTVTIPVEG